MNYLLKFSFKRINDAWMYGKNQEDKSRKRRKNWQTIKYVI